MTDGIRVAIFGATGMSGAEVLAQATDDPRVTEIVLVTRRALGVNSGKVREVVHSDFSDFGAIAGDLDGLDAVFWLLGVSQLDVPDEAEYRKITHDFTMAAARLVKQGSPKAAFHFISGVGTKKNGRQLWQRVKAETEVEVMALGLGRVACYRPGLIFRSRAKKSRYLFERVLRPLRGLLLLSRGFCITGEQFGKAMLEAQFTGASGILENRTLRKLADQARRWSTDRVR